MAPLLRKAITYPDVSIYLCYVKVFNILLNLSGRMSRVQHQLLRRGIPCATVTSLMALTQIFGGSPRMWNRLVLTIMKILLVNMWNITLQCWFQAQKTSKSAVLKNESESLWDSQVKKKKVFITSSLKILELWCVNWDPRSVPIAPHLHGLFLPLRHPTYKTYSTWQEQHDSYKILLPFGKFISKLFKKWMNNISHKFE